MVLDHQTRVINESPSLGIDPADGRTTESNRDLPSDNRVRPELDEGH